jgi:hypothetical protein
MFHVTTQTQSPFYFSGQDQTLQDARLVEKIAVAIFSINREVIPALIDPLIRHPDYTLLNDLIIKIFSDEEHSHEEVITVFGEVARHSSFPFTLCSLISTNPEIFIKAITSLPKEISADSCLMPVLQIQRQISYLDFVNCVKILGLSKNEDAAETFDLFLGLLDQETFETVAQNLVANISSKDLGELLSLTEDPETATQFINLFLEKYYDNTLEIICFIKAVVRASFKREVTHPYILEELLRRGNENGYRILSILLNSDEKIPRKVFRYVLKCLPEDGLKDYLIQSHIKNDYKKQISSMDLFITSETNFNKKIAIVSQFIQDLSEVKLQLFLKNMLEMQSRSIPFLCSTMTNETFAVFSFIIEPELRTGLQRLSLTPDKKTNRDMIAHLKKLGRAQTLCSFSVMEIVSQEIVQIGTEQYGKRATLMDFANYITLGLDANDLENQMAKASETFAEIPPFLLAMAMTDKNFRMPFIATVRYMKDGQLKAFAEQISKKRAVTTINQMMETASMDQMSLILSSLPSFVAEIYIKTKGQKMGGQFGSIEEKQKILKSSLMEIKQGDDFKKRCNALYEECVTQNKHLRELLSPLNLAIQKHAKEMFTECEKEKAEDFARITTIISRSVIFQKEVQQILLSLKDISAIPEVAVQTDFDINRIPFNARNFITEEMLKSSGISYNEDITHLGIVLNKAQLDETELHILWAYLQSELLKEIWAFFKGKNLGTISDLVTACLIDEPDDLLNLITIARKMGY